VQRAGKSVVVTLVAALAAGCAGPPAPSSEAQPPLSPARCVPAAARRALDVALRTDRARYAAAMARARAFLDGLEVDPLKLRAAGIKGKKKLVEALDAYGRLHRLAPAEQRPALLARIEELARPTKGDRYHDMLEIDDREFHEDATSYLRAAVLLDELGVDVTRYRTAIRAMKPRLDEHMLERGPHQRRAFHAYYQRFGLEEPFPLEGALEAGLIAKRPDPDGLSRADAYALTHEVYAAYDFGDRLDDDPFGDAARLYLRGALPRMVGTYQSKRDPDLVAELVACIRYVKFTGDPAYADGLRYLLDAQNADGSWGSYEAARARLGDLVKQGLYLHTTMVAIEALSLGFEDDYRRRDAPECP
jgi:hypothetical protein